MQITINCFDRGCGSHETIVEEPYASALANIDGLARATDNATYRGVRFGRSKQGSMVIYLSSVIPYSMWPAKSPDGMRHMDVAEERLQKILDASAAIDAVITSAVPARPTYQCAGHNDGCSARVSSPGAFCRSCDFDENDN